MPGWMDLLNPMVPKRAISGIQEQLAPGSSADIEGGISDIPAALADIWGNLGQGETDLAMQGGFVSGALEGLRNLTTPLDALGLAGFGNSIGTAAKMAAPALARPMAAAGRTLSRIDDLPIPQRGPTASYADNMMQELQGNLASVPNATGQMRRPAVGNLTDDPQWVREQHRMATEALRALGKVRGRPMTGEPARQFTGAAGPNLPEFVPRGGEAMFNMRRPPSTGPDINMMPPIMPGSGRWAR